MIVECICNQAYFSPLVLPFNICRKMCDQNFITSTEGFTIGDGRVGVALTKGRRYTIYGLLIYKNEIRYLIQNDSNIPEFYLSELFVMIDKTILFDWELKIYQIETEKLFLFGYSDLVENFESLRDLITNTPTAIKKFLDYKSTL